MQLDAKMNGQYILLFYRNFFPDLQSEMFFTLIHSMLLYCLYC